MLEENKGLSISTVTAALVGYITVCGVLWHLGYWSTFDFNYLTYVSITDLFKSAVQPFFSNLIIWINVIIFMFCWGLLNLLIFFINVFSKRKKIDLFKTEQSEFLESGNVKYLIIGLCFSSLFFLNISFSRNFLVVLTWGFGLGLLLTLFYLDVLKKYFKSDFMRFSFQGILIFYAVFNFTNAKNQSLALLSRYQFKQVSRITLSDTSMNKLYLNKPYLGTCDKYSFVLDSNNSVMIIPNDQIKSLSLLSVLNYDNNAKWEKSSLHFSPKDIDSNAVPIPVKDKTTN